MVAVIMDMKVNLLLAQNLLLRILRFTPVY